MIFVYFALDLLLLPDQPEDFFHLLLKPPFLLLFPPHLRDLPFVSVHPFQYHLQLGLDVDGLPESIVTAVVQKVEVIAGAGF